MASGIARGRVHTMAAMATTVESRNMAADRLTDIYAPLVCSGSMPPFLGRIFKEKKIHSYQQTIAELDLTFLIKGCTKLSKKINK